jgi:hypothetical protein
MFFSRRFFPIFITQFLGAFNDNVYKNAVCILITYRAYTLGTLDPNSVVALAGGIFILPFFLFSAIAGQLSDKYPKHKIIVWTKYWEVMVMMLAVLGFYFENFIFLLVVLFLMGAQSAFFGPAKYSILPELLPKKELLTGNAYFGTGTFLSILLGTIIGGSLIALTNGSVYVSVIIILVAIFGVVTAKKVPVLAAGVPDLVIEKNPVLPIWRVFKLVSQNQGIFYAIFGYSWFWFLGAAILSLIPGFTKDVIYGDESVATFFLATFSIGIAIGSMLCEKLSFKKVELGLVPIGALGISIFLLNLFLLDYSHFTPQGNLITLAIFLNTSQSIFIVFNMVMMAIFCGFYFVPLLTMIQERSPQEIRSRIISGTNIINSLFMVLSAIYLILLYKAGLTIPQVLLSLSLMNLAVAFFIYLTIPEYLYRFYCWIVANIIYRIRVKGIENIPSEGGALLICNHVSYVDWLILSSTSPRPIRFVMHYSFHNLPLFGNFFKRGKVIPIAGQKENPEIMENAFLAIAKELKDGELVCIFPEGFITRTGEVDFFRPGVLRVLKETPITIVPMAINGLWGSFFSRKDDLALRKPFRRWYSRVNLAVGEAIDPETILNLEELSALSKLQEKVIALLK